MPCNSSISRDFQQARSALFFVHETFDFARAYALTFRVQVALAACSVSPARALVLSRASLKTFHSIVSFIGNTANVLLPTILHIFPSQAVSTAFAVAEAAEEATTDGTKPPGNGAGEGAASTAAAAAAATRHGPEGFPRALATLRLTRLFASRMVSTLDASQLRAQFYSDESGRMAPVAAVPVAAVALSPRGRRKQRLRRRRRQAGGNNGDLPPPLPTP